MIKGLYFKLNMENEGDKYIYEYFNRRKKAGYNKVNVLSALIRFAEQQEKLFTRFEEQQTDWRKKF